jgi:hypothetical protein
MQLLAPFVIIGLLALIFGSIQVGRRVGFRRWARVAEDARVVYPAVEASVLALMGLLIAFTFYGAASRFDNRRMLIAQEANAIGTAYLRIDLLPADTQPRLREDFRNYLRSRLAVFEKFPDAAAVRTELDRSAALQRELWQHAVAASRESGPATQSLLLGSINEMIDITTTRLVAWQAHPPVPVFIALGLTVVLASVLVGYGMSAARNQDWIPIVTFSLLLGALVYVILDYEFPRAGLIRVSHIDQVLIDTLQKMNEP